MSRFPVWLRKKIDIGGDYYGTRNLLEKHRLATVCESANCPNKFECFSARTATVMILGRNCTRKCLFCRVEKNGAPETVDPDEPRRVAEWVKKAGLRFVVITSVTRDDLPDGGAGHFKRTAEAVKKLNSNVKLEVLVPDYKGDRTAIRTTCECDAEVLGHNVETVSGLYPRVRPGADYGRSLDLLREFKKYSLKKKVKSSIILGIGENRKEVEKTIEDIAGTGCDMLVIGQYLRAGKGQIEVDRFLPPEEFEELKEFALSVGIEKVFAGPWYRSSYKAEEMAED